jgi:rhamnosyltransferase
MNRICAAVVTYFPTESVIENIRLLARQVDEIVIIDNGTEGSGCEYLQQIQKNEAVTIVWNKKNLGIAVALNIGVVYARNKGHEWLATFDQDSQVTANMISIMLAAFIAYPDKDRVAILTPTCKDQFMARKSGDPSIEDHSNNKNVVEILTTITSGSIFKLTIFDAVGSFDESMFIDYVDHEFCLRCRKHNFKILEVTHAILLHNLGMPIQRQFLWKKITIRNHTPSRHYYTMRNRIITWRRYFASFPTWVITDSCKCIWTMLKVLFYEEMKSKKFKAILHGLYHGIIGKSS